MYRRSLSFIIDLDFHFHCHFDILTPGIRDSSCCSCSVTKKSMANTLSGVVEFAGGQDDIYCNIKPQHCNNCNSRSMQMKANQPNTCIMPQSNPACHEHTDVPRPGPDEYPRVLTKRLFEVLHEPIKLRKFIATAPRVPDNPTFKFTTLPDPKLKNHYPSGPTPTSSLTLKYN